MKKVDSGKINNKIWNFVDKHTDVIYFSLIVIIAIIIRIIILKQSSGDYDLFLKPWFEELKDSGGLPGLAKNIGNYSPPYMTILALLTYLPIDSLTSIKIVSIIFDFISAIAIMKIVEELLKDKEYKRKISMLLSGIYLFLPTVFLNSAHWAQCDQIYTSFILISILFLLKNDFKKGIIFWAIAFSFKLQAIFIFPLYVLMYISDHKNIKFSYFLLIPVVVFALSIPKVIYSHDLLVGFNTYFGQANSYSEYASLNFPNFYSIFLKTNVNSNLISNPNQDFNSVGILITFFILITIAFFVYTKKIKFDKKAVIDFGLFSVLITTFFLPQMHERYLFVGDALGILYLVYNKEKYYIPITIELISLYGYMSFLFSLTPINISTMGIVFLIIIIIYTKNMINNYFKY